MVSYYSYSYYIHVLCNRAVGVATGVSRSAEMFSTRKGFSVQRWRHPINGEGLRELCGPRCGTMYYEYCHIGPNIPNSVAAERDIRHCLRYCYTVNYHAIHWVVGVINRRDILIYARDRLHRIIFHAHMTPVNPSSETCNLLDILASKSIEMPSIEDQINRNLFLRLQI
jgi:hypothetical protein